MRNSKGYRNFCQAILIKFSGDLLPVCIMSLDIRKYISRLNGTTDTAIIHTDWVVLPVMFQLSNMRFSISFIMQIYKFPHDKAWTFTFPQLRIDNGFQLGPEKWLLILLLQLRVSPIQSRDLPSRISQYDLLVDPHNVLKPGG